MFCTPGQLKKREKSLLFSWAAKAEMEQGVSVIVRESRVEMMPACSRFMKDTPFVDSRGHSRTRAAALCFLLSQAVRSLMVQEKQMPPAVSLVFLLDALHYTM